MTPRDTVNLLQLVAHLCPAMRIEEHTAEAWHLVIGHLDPEDCVAAVRETAREKPFIAPSDIATRVTETRNNRLRLANLVYEPQPDETVIDFQARLRAKQEAAAAGRVLPTRPVLALPPGSAAPIPAVLGKRLDDYRATDQNPALEVPCPWCGSSAGSWCKKYRNTGKRPEKQYVRGFVHPSRAEAATAGITR